MPASQDNESTPWAEMEGTADIITPGESVAAWRAALDRKLPITEADVHALLTAAAEHRPQAGIDVTTDILTPGEVAAWQEALDRKLPITEADLRALLAAAVDFPDPRTFIAEGKTEIRSVNRGSLESRLWDMLTEFHDVTHGRIEFVTTLAWTTDRRLLWFTNGCAHDEEPKTRIVHFMGQLSDAIGALRSEFDVLTGEQPPMYRKA